MVSLISDEWQSRAASRILEEGLLLAHGRAAQSRDGMRLMNPRGGSMDKATGSQTARQSPGQARPVFARREFFGLGAAALGGSLLVAACGSGGNSSTGGGSAKSVSLTMF